MRECLQDKTLCGLNGNIENKKTRESSRISIPRGGQGQILGTEMDELS